MKRKILLFCIGIIIFCRISFAQKLYLNTLGGFANYAGDITQASFTLKESHPAFGVGISFFLSNKFSIRGEFNSAFITGDDKNNKKQGIIDRNLNFSTKISELNVRVEYDYLSIEKSPITPYSFLGIASFKFSPYTYDDNNVKVSLRNLSTEGQGLPQYPNRNMYKLSESAIIYGSGIKYHFNDDLNISFELGYRKTSTDYLDDVSTNYVDENILLAERGALAVALAWRGDEKTNPQAYPVDGASRGNPRAKDYYYFGQIRLAFRLNWFDNDFYSSGNNKKFGCPKPIL